MRQPLSSWLSSTRRRHYQIIYLMPLRHLAAWSIAVILPTSLQEAMYERLHHESVFADAPPPIGDISCAISMLT